MESKRDSSASGEVMEFRVWAELIEQSGGALHIFLPLLDRGLDGVAHRLTDRAYLPLQVKGRAALRDGSLTIVVRDDSLVDDDAWMICGLSTSAGLGEEVLVVQERDFKRLASRSVFDGHDVYEAIFSMHPHASRWAEFLRPRDRLAEPLMAGVPAPPGFSRPAVAPADRTHSWLGFLGEAEVVRRLFGAPLSSR